VKDSWRLTNTWIEENHHKEWITNSRPREVKERKEKQSRQQNLDTL
jgi:hypothetical protein